MSRRRCSRLALLALLAAGTTLLWGCGLLNRREAPQVYVLPAAPLCAAALDPLPLTLRLGVPRANRHLSGARILVMPEAHRLSAYQGVRWGDNAPALLGGRLAEAFRQSGRLAAVVDESERVSADFELASDLGAFQSEYVQGRPQAVIRLDVRLIESGRQRVLAARRFEVREPSADDTIPAVVEAFGRAAGALSLQVVQWSLERMAAS
jgi:cholesterol transport system auxiliary component